MPSAFDDLFESFAAPMLQTHFGEVVTYTVDGESETLVGMVTEERIEEQHDEHGRKYRTIRDVDISRDPNADTVGFTVDTGGVAEPRLDATLLIGGVLYAADSIVSQSVHRTTLRVVRIESVEQGRGRYRG